MPQHAHRLVLMLLIIITLAALVGCGDELSPKPEVSAHGTWTFGIDKSL